MKAAWDRLASPDVLSHFNWSGISRKDRPAKKGVRKLRITKAILSKHGKSFIMFKVNLRILLDALRSNAVTGKITDSEFEEFSKDALKNMPRVSKYLRNSNSDSGAENRPASD